MLNVLPDHPVIRNLERAGTPDGKEPQYPHCPVCDSECATIYKNMHCNIVGCEECISRCDAWSTEECFPERE